MPSALLDRHHEKGEQRWLAPLTVIAKSSNVAWLLFSYINGMGEKLGEDRERK
jgi:hypothetical protein